MRAYAVIGANYGDEGKGLFTDYIAHREIDNHRSTLVCRFNGGAQAGHTVVRPDGSRHVFNHFGAGSIAGASTYLGPKFVVNPFVFLYELEDLKKLSCQFNQQIYVHQDCLVTLPFDVDINQAKERQRGDELRHGSCGLGFHETIVRNQARRSFTVFDIQILSLKHLADRIYGIYQSYHSSLYLYLNAEPSCDNIEDASLKIATIFKKFVSMVTIVKSLPTKYNSVVFEGAQGLGLDMDAGHFPHVTHSHTGVDNIIEIAEDAGISHVMTVFATRSYLTRHGQGPIEGYREINPPAFSDPTNVHNEWQGSLKRRPLDINIMGQRIRQNLAKANGSSVLFYPFLGMSCLDQWKNVDIPHILGKKIYYKSPLRFFYSVINYLEIEPFGFSYGPCRENVNQLSDDE